jgi:CDP-paratose 2-epimerase
MKRVLITGGAGFIGTNLSDRLAARGAHVIILDNLSRSGVERNLAWLQAHHGENVRFMFGDIRDRTSVLHAVDQAEMIFHLAAQVAVTASLQDPETDFEINARGTLNVLEAARRKGTPILFTSTNKVYGPLADLPIVETATRYLSRGGIHELRSLELHSPHGCSKGAADQYVVDHARSFGVPAVVLRLSCVYGPHQLGSEDQGWVAHFLRSAIEGAPLTIYGDGKQVRDLLFIDDLVDACEVAMARMELLSGRVFNLGGGADRTLSLLELLDWIGRALGRRPEVTREDWRPGDQRWYVSDTRAFERATGWHAQTGIEEGLARLFNWLSEAAPIEEEARS